MTSALDLEQRRRLDLEHKSILIIDESSFALKIVAEMCGSFGLGSIATGKGIEYAFATMNATHYDVVICDWGTPPLDGSAFVRRVRASAEERVKRTPIILMKAHAAAPDVVLAREAGVTEFLARPFSAQTLFNHLISIFSKPREFVTEAAFTGPDRRRRRPGEQALTRRNSDGPKG